MSSEVQESTVDRQRYRAIMCFVLIVLCAGAIGVLSIQATVRSSFDEIARAENARALFAENLIDRKSANDLIEKRGLEWRVSDVPNDRTNYDRFYEEFLALPHPWWTRVTGIQLLAAIIQVAAALFMLRYCLRAKGGSNTEVQNNAL
jgi:hypothetical protein